MAKLITETSYDFKLHEDSKNNNMYIVGIFSTAEMENNNKRKYGRSILEREITKVGDKIKKNCLWGELGHPPCVYGDTEILTLNGWKRIDSINSDEIVATLNKDTRKIEYNKIDEKIESPFKGKMYRYKNRQVDIAFTPNHRHLIFNRYEKPVFATSEEIENCETRFFRKSYIPKTGEWVGNEEDFFILKGIDHIPHSKYDYTEDIKIDLMTFSGFIGLYLAEGNVVKNNKNRISIYQNEGKNADKIRKLLSEFPEEMKWKENNKNGKIVWGLSDGRLAKYIKPLGCCYHKYIPQELKELDVVYLKEMLDWFLLGDGRNYIYEDKYEKKDIFSTSERMIDDFHEIAFKCGISARKTVELCEIDYKIEDRVIKAKNKKPLYFLKLLSSKGIYMFDKHTKLSKEFYEGNVYCVRVKNQNFYCRNKNSVSFWTGNCPEVNPDKIALKIENLEWKGNNVYGKAKLIDTPMGNIAKTLVKEGSMGISSRGLGTVGDNGYVNEDFNLITYDLVTDPSNKPSWVNGIYEGTEFSINTNVEEIKEEQIKEAQKVWSRHIWQVLENIEKNI